MRLKDHPGPRTVGADLALALSLGAAMLPSGCAPGDGLDRRAIAGAVTLDGRPLDDGTILFEPLSPEAGTAVGAPIRAGRFAVPRAEGPVPGVYRVRVYASAGVQAPPKPGESPGKARPMLERVPARYNAESRLEAEVTADGPDPYRFDLTTPDGTPDPTP